MPLIQTKAAASAAAFGLNSFDLDLGAYYPIQTILATGSSTEFQFLNIPQDYKHLEIRWFIRTNFSAEDTIYAYGFDTNAGGSTNTSFHFFGSDGSTTTTKGTGIGSYSGILGYAPGANQPSGAYSSGIMTVHNYSIANRAKTFTGWGGYDANGSGKITNFGNTPLASFTNNAWTIVRILCNGTIQSGSYATLYGIKG